jgi:hypothetical protein
MYKNVMLSLRRSAMLALAVVPLCQTLVNASVVPQNGLVGFWSGNDTAADSSPVHNNGSFSGSYVAGRPGGDAAFDLSTGIVYIPYNNAYDFTTYPEPPPAPGWTVGFWFNAHGVAPNSGNDTFLGEDAGPGYQPKWFIDYGYTVYGPNNQFIWHVNDWNQERIFEGSEVVSPFPSGWNQLTVVTDNIGHTVSFYLNGEGIGVSSIPGYTLETTNPLLFGQAEGLYYHGYMNDVALYDRALSAAEVLDLVNATETAPEPASLPVVAFIAGTLILVRKRGMLLGNGLAPADRNRSALTPFHQFSGVQKIQNIQFQFLQNGIRRFGGKLALAFQHIMDVGLRNTSEAR